MAPIASPARLPAALIDFLAPREATPQPQHVTSSPIAAIARRFHSLPQLTSLATRTSPSAPSHVLEARQEGTTATIPGAYPGVNAGPDPGTVVGITLGSVAAFLLLLWLVYTCLSMGNSSAVETVSSYGTASVVTRKSRRRHSSHHHHHRSPARRETVEIRTSRETLRRSGTPPSRPVGLPPRMVQGEEDEVVVIEEHTPPRRHKSRSHKRRSSSARRESGIRESGFRESGFRESGFREVEPDRFAGGDAPIRDVRRTSRHGR
ncbi:hypothetical protein VP1G_07904 [Cytospora mali]|uniref:Uncharacterized protein n=1 Tax=Cytospora mali TaxID=578113 RepID=A0A194V9Z7_CYTMA|nr:hypothetical protein VP1G_07904 [Valsa mali var. pyri (nom. inval.)]